MSEYRELRFQNPYRAVEELEEASGEGWEPVCPLSVGDGYLMMEGGKEE